jgi:hypothetical protein
MLILGSLPRNHLDYALREGMAGIVRVDLTFAVLLVQRVRTIPLLVFLQV